MSLDSSSKYRAANVPRTKSTGGEKREDSSSHFLDAGQVYVSPKAQSIVLILGSCVAVCIWDAVNGIGGAAHYLLPEWDGWGTASPRYGSVAIGTLLQKLGAAGASREHLRAKVFGGALVKGTRTDGAGIDRLGSRNVETALEILAEERIPIAYVEAMGSREQRVVFQTDSGKSLVTCL